jgi:hypothetical protein
MGTPERKARLVPNVSEADLRALALALFEGIAKRPGERFHRYGTPTPRGLLLEALEVVEAEIESF